MLGSERILALDIGASTVKVGEFQASKGHGLRLTNFNFADLGIDPEHEENRKALIVSTVRNVVREKNIKATNVIFSRPSMNRRSCRSSSTKHSRTSPSRSTK
jgi:hypothetical protein